MIHRTLPDNNANAKNTKKTLCMAFPFARRVEFMEVIGHRVTRCLSEGWFNKHLMEWNLIHSSKKSCLGAM